MVALVVTVLAFFVGVGSSEAYLCCLLASKKAVRMPDIKMLSTYRVSLNITIGLGASAAGLLPPRRHHRTSLPLRNIDCHIFNLPTRKPLVQT